MHSIDSISIVYYVQGRPRFLCLCLFVVHRKSKSGAEPGRSSSDFVVSLGLREPRCSVYDCSDYTICNPDTAQRQYLIHFQHVTPTETIGGLHISKCNAFEIDTIVVADCHKNGGKIAKESSDSRHSCTSYLKRLCTKVLQGQDKSCCIQTTVKSFRLLPHPVTFTGCGNISCSATTVKNDDRCTYIKKFVRSLTLSREESYWLWEARVGNAGAKVGSKNSWLRQATSGCFFFRVK